MASSPIVPRAADSARAGLTRELGRLNRAAAQIAHQSVVDSRDGAAVGDTVSVSSSARAQAESAPTASAPAPGGGVPKGAEVVPAPRAEGESETTAPEAVAGGDGFVSSLVDLSVAKYSAIANLKVLSTVNEVEREAAALLDRDKK
jgi:hypothetical protein